TSKGEVISNPKLHENGDWIVLPAAKYRVDPQDSYKLARIAHREYAVFPEIEVTAAVMVQENGKAHFLSKGIISARTGSTIDSILLPASVFGRTGLPVEVPFSDPSGGPSLLDRISEFQKL